MFYGKRGSRGWIQVCAVHYKAVAVNYIFINVVFDQMSSQKVERTSATAPNWKRDSVNVDSSFTQQKRQKSTLTVILKML